MHFLALHYGDLDDFDSVLTAQVFGMQYFVGTLLSLNFKMV